jgi:hypothetical protein
MMFAQRPTLSTPWTHVCFWMFLLNLMFSSFALANISMKVNEPKISIHDTLTLTLTSDQASASGQPNLHPLQKDFNLLSTEHRVNYQFINGAAQSTNEWILILLPKHPGKIVIPPLSIGQETAQQSLMIEVSSEASATQLTSDLNQDNILIKTQISPTSAYVNAQILYTVKVYNRFHLVDVEYTPPQADHALIIPLARGNQYQATHHQKIYAVEELNYAIFPSQPGTLNISPPTIKALMVDLVPQRVHAEGKPRQITIQTLPAGSDQLMPAHGLTLEENFPQPDTPITQGSSIQRTIKIKAYGVPASLIPNLNFDGPGFSAYPSPGESHDEQNAQGLVGEKTIHVNYLFNQAGSITLPELKLTWFNTKTKQQEHATLLAHHFNVTADASLNTANTAPNPTTSSSQSAPSPIKSITPPSFVINTNLWIILGLLISSLSLVYIAALIRSYRSKFKTMSKHPEPRQDVSLPVRQIKNQLKQFCLNHQPKQAATELLKWANTRWPKQDFLHLKQVALQCQDQNLAQQIQILTEILYRPMKPVEWRGELLWKAFEAYTKRTVYGTTESKKSLPELNPR